jgi:hypothetical protein
VALTAACAAALTGCAEPFAVQRDTLGPFRVAAVGVTDGVASAAVWAGQPLHEAPVELAWTLDGAPLGEGWDVAVPDDSDGRELGLTATAPDGTTRQARVTVAAAPASFGVGYAGVDLGGIWTLEDRRAAKAVSLDGRAVPEGLAARVHAASGDAATATVAEVRLMVADGDGTLLRLDERTTDLLREDLRFDDGALASRQPIDPGVALALALAFDGEGRNRWSWLSIPMGLDGAWVSSGGLSVDLGGTDSSTGLVAVTLADLDPASSEITLSDPESVSDLDQQEPLDCAIDGAPFRLSWLHGGRCAVSDVEGARVVLEVSE